MKKIRNIRHLEAEKKRLREKTEALEIKLKSDWHSLKDSIQPVTMAKEAVQDMLRKKAESNIEEENLLKTAFNYAMTLLWKKLA